jgi:alpha-L-fucosidase
MYSGPQDEGKVMAAEEIVKFYRDAVAVGNLFTLAIGPDRAGRFREIDVKTLREAGRMIRESP